MEVEDKSRSSSSVMSAGLGTYNMKNSGEILIGQGLGEFVGFETPIGVTFEYIKGKDYRRKDSVYVEKDISAIIGNSLEFSIGFHRLPNGMKITSWKITSGEATFIR